jgi:FtsP/CotA-like multicopper oxidase with cupredoxin domain
MVSRHNYLSVVRPIHKQSSRRAFDLSSRALIAEYNVNGVPDLLRWAVNNISTSHGSETVVALAVETARRLGWPKPIAKTVEMPLNPPVVWDYTTRVLDPGGPGKVLGVLSEAVMSLEQGQVVEFVLQNTRAINGVAEYHPWHAHGHSFWVVGQGQGIYNPATDVAKYNLKNPVLRDTVSLQPLSWVAIRFLLDNPGAWFFHCHILSHHVMGMGCHGCVAQFDRRHSTQRRVLQ